MIKKLQNNGLRAKSDNFRQFFDDFSGYRHATGKILTVLESARSPGSFDTHKAYICDEKNFNLIRGTSKLKLSGGTLKTQLMRLFLVSFCLYDHTEWEKFPGNFV